MIEIIRDSTPKARKAYRCNASEFVREALQEQVRFSFSDLRKIVKARQQGWIIRPGQVYTQQVNKFEGDFCVFRAIPEMAELCHKYDLYPEP